MTRRVIARGGRDLITAARWRVTAVLAVVLAVVAASGLMVAPGGAVASSRPAADVTGADPRFASSPSDLARRPKWKRDCVPDPAAATVVDVRAHGATGDGATDDTAAFNQAVAAVAGTGGTLLVPPGDYRINPEVSVRMGSDLTLRLADGAQLRALASDAPASAVVSVRGVHDVRIVGGTIIGDRTIHQGTTGEWGHGISIIDSQRVRVQDVEAREAWGDGFYIGGMSTNGVVVCRSLADENRRQGMSITAGRNIVVRGSVFRDTYGTPPELGIDVEPNEGDQVTNVLLWRNRLRDNHGGGLSFGITHAHKATTGITGGFARANRVIHNGDGALFPQPRFGILVSSIDRVRVARNYIHDNLGVGVIVAYSTGTKVVRNVITGTRPSSKWAEGGAGIHLEETTGVVCAANQVHDNLGQYQVYSFNSDTPREACTQPRQ